MQPAKDSGSGGNAIQKEPTSTQGTPSQTHPSLFNFLHPEGLQKISDYCARKSQEEPDKWLHEKFICDVHVTDVAIAIFTFLLVLVTIPLTLVGFCQARIASRTAKQELRAYMFLRSARLENFAAGQTPIAKIAIKNFGKTPAYEVTQWSNMGFDTYPPRIEPPMHDQPNLPDRPVPPGEKVFQEATLGRPLNPDEVCGLKKGEVALYVIGRIRYVDAFGRKQFTEFRLFSGGPIGLDDRMASFERGNRAT